MNHCRGVVIIRAQVRVESLHGSPALQYPIPSIVVIARYHDDSEVLSKLVDQSSGSLVLPPTPIVGDIAGNQDSATLVLLLFCAPPVFR